MPLKSMIDKTVCYTYLPSPAMEPAPVASHDSMIRTLFGQLATPTTLEYGKAIEVYVRYLLTYT